MFVLVTCALLLYRVTRGLGFLRFLAALAIDAALVSVFVSAMALAHKARRRSAPKLIYAYGSFAVYPLIYGVGSFAPCLPSWIFIGLVQHYKDERSIWQGLLLASGLVCAVYLWGFYKKLARAFGKDDAFARRLFFAYPLALAELAFGPSRYQMECHCNPEPVYDPID